MRRLPRERGDVARLRRRAERHRHHARGDDAEERLDEATHFRYDERHVVAFFVPSDCRAPPIAHARARRSRYDSTCI
ncbi:MAG: hypothetical protein QM736_25160 [Vicinamibacterales bacterium]